MEKDKKLIECLERLSKNNDEYYNKFLIEDSPYMKMALTFSYVAETIKIANEIKNIKDNNEIK